jgi:PAS domain S-box-containing protein
MKTTTDCQLLGYTEAELRQLGRDALRDTSDPCFPAALQERQHTGRIQGELTLVRKDGSHFPVEVSSILFTDPDGNAQTINIVRDITLRKRTEAALRESEERFRLLSTASPMGIFLNDAAGQTVLSATLEGGTLLCLAQ